MNNQNRFLQNHTLNRSYRRLILLGVILALGLAYALTYEVSEPFYNSDETRHVMTGVYFRDVLHDLPVTNLQRYTIDYYLQYPALGLLVWPPFFYFVEGVAMSVFGTSPVVAKALIGCFAVMACVYLFRLICRSHDSTKAAVAALIFGFSPLVFNLAHFVMIEVPTLALGLAAVYHFVRYLDLDRRRDLFLSGVVAALAALTRFDAIYLLPLFLILLIVRKRWGILRRAEVLAAAALALLLVAPFYAISAGGIGWMHFKFVTETLSPSDHGFLSVGRLLFYPSCLPAQFSLVALIPAAIGLVYGARGARRKASWPYLAMIMATYLTFTPMGELESRHAIYWLPAFSLFAADGIAILAHWLRAPKLYVPLALFITLGIAWPTVATPQPFVRGYEQAARYVIANSRNSPRALFVGSLNGNFIYQIRRHDPDRRFWVLRADKLLFSVLTMPGVQYKQLAASDEDMLATIFKYDPEFVVVEVAREWSDQAPIEDRIRTAFENRVKRVLKSNPERFQLEEVITLDGQVPGRRGMQLQVFRNTLRNENPERRLDVEVMMLRRSLQSGAP